LKKPFWEKRRKNNGNFTYSDLRVNICTATFIGYTITSIDGGLSDVQRKCRSRKHDEHFYQLPGTNRLLHLHHLRKASTDGFVVLSNVSRR
jgi:hypothetical protein